MTSVNEDQPLSIKHTAMISTELLTKLAALPENLQQEVGDYAEFLLTKYHVQAAKPLAFGMMKGTFAMSDDFDAPLADFNEYMS